MHTAQSQITGIAAGKIGHHFRISFHGAGAVALIVLSQTYIVVSHGIAWINLDGLIEMLQGRTELASGQELHTGGIRITGSSRSRQGTRNRNSDMHTKACRYCDQG
ncbi:MAG: hypothetical protein BWY75_01147 [bacterium ADurb.Bin425]|nr:MAG: hypothetical protein BWY75_01147 [bacterium ADurb.Bin425]